jgi:5-methyltetrahydropteroyltriglutamate--homocysteine methyltransferase
MTTTPLGPTVLGYPRIGGNRELKRAVESYWAGKLDEHHLAQAGAAIRTATWSTLGGAGLGSVPSNTFSYYDHVLDTAVMIDAVPDRYRTLGLSSLDTYFAMARGTDEMAPLELTKWFDTNYHYLVPEIGPETQFAPRPDKPIAELAEATALGIPTRPVLVGPVTLLLLAKAPAGARETFRPVDRLDDVLDCYAGILDALSDAGADWVQLDEPAFVADRTSEEIEALRRAYERLGSQVPRLFVATYFGDVGDAMPVLLDAPVEAVGLDMVAGPRNVELLARYGPAQNRTIVAGVVDGRNVWRTDLPKALAAAASLLGSADNVTVSSSCSLQHVPLDLTAEPNVDPVLVERLAFARQKVDEVVALGRGLTEGAAALPASQPGSSPTAWARPAVRARLAAMGPDRQRRGPYAQRAAAQAANLGLPPLPATTIGSFPQTAKVRAARADLRAGRIDEATYVEQMRAEITDVVRLQERLGLDVLVHGEPERNDMVQYFAEQLDGFATTTNGWVQSYGSRCVRPPILYGDVARPQAMTVDWTAYAQSLTTKPVKGMLTGPVTILAWSFVRDDQPRADTAMQVALALRDEAHDLESAGIRIIQIDEPALRELLPPRSSDHAAYLDWAVAAFRTASSGVSDSAQIHTHLCYSEFGDVIHAIDAMDADVTSLEASRSRMEVLDDLADAGYARGVGPGVYDIHSPRIPDVAEITAALHRAVKAVPPERLWVNPDCGLKTRDYSEVEPALANLVAATTAVRAQL